MAWTALLSYLPHEVAGGGPRPAEGVVGGQATDAVYGMRVRPTFPYLLAFVAICACSNSRSRLVYSVVQVRPSSLECAIAS